MSTSPALSSSPPRPARSPGATTPSATSVSTPRHTHYSHHHHHHHHLPVGHTTHSPATSASGDIIQGKPSEAGGLHTSTSRGNILVPPGVVNVGSLSPVSSTAASTPADLLSVSSRSPSAASRPASPSAPSSPSILASAAANASPLQARSPSSRPTSPARSPIHPRSPTIKHQQQQPDFETMSNSTTPSMDSSAVFERDVEFATEHLLTGSEAIDLAAAPVLSEVALAVTSNTPDNNNIVNTTSNLIAASPSPSPLSASNLNNTTATILGGTSTHSPFAQSLDSTVLSSSPKLPSNAVLFNNDAAIGADDRQAIQPLSERLRRSSGAAAATTAAAAIAPASQANANVRPISDEFSPPPSLSLSPSATASPISSAPGSPIHHIGASSGQFGHAVVGMDSSTGGIAAGGPAGLEVNDGSMSGFSSPPGSAMSGVSISGNKDSKRRLSMISYADIINSERLSDSHSGLSSPTPSSAMSLSTAALPVQCGQSGSNAGLSPAASGMLGSALYSPVTSPEGSLSPALAPPSAKDSMKELESTREGDGTFSKPANNRTDTMSTTATEVFYMPGQLPLQTPPNITDKQEEDKDVTPTSSSIKKTSDIDDGERKDDDELKKLTSSSSWNMVEMGKALVGSAAGAVGSVLGTSGIGSDSPDPAEIEKDN